MGLLSERLCSTGRRSFPIFVFMKVLGPLGVDFGVFLGWLSAVFSFVFLTSFFEPLEGVLDSFSGPSEGHFGTRFNPDCFFQWKRAICIICVKIRCFSMILRTDGALLPLLSERLCSTGRRSFPILFL